MQNATVEKKMLKFTLIARVEPWLHTELSVTSEKEDLQEEILRQFRKNGEEDVEVFKVQIQRWIF